MDSRSQTRVLSVFFVIYIGYRSLVDSLQCNVESTLKLDYEGVSIPISPCGPHYELIYLVGMGNEGWIDSRFTFVDKGILEIMQGYIGVSEQGLWIRLID